MVNARDIVVSYRVITKPWSDQARLNRRSQTWAAPRRLGSRRAPLRICVGPFVAVRKGRPPSRLRFVAVAMVIPPRRQLACRLEAVTLLDIVYNNALQCAAYGRTDFD